MLTTIELPCGINQTNCSRLLWVTPQGVLNIEAEDEQGDSNRGIVVVSMLKKLEAEFCTKVETNTGTKFKQCLILNDC